jgi:hypothetical protein
VHALGDVLERPNGFLARLVLREPEISELEERDRRREALRRAGAEELLRLIQRDNGGETTLVAQSAQRQ